MSKPVLREPRATARGAREPHWIGVVKFSRDHPCEWVLAGEYSAGVAPAIRRGEYPAFLPSDYDGDRAAYVAENFDVTVNTIKGSTARRTEVFIKYVGDERG
jgi:hypothetical protein